MYTTVSRHASVAYVSVQLGHPENFTHDRAQSTYNEVCQECQRLIKEESITFIRLVLFVYSNSISVWNAYSDIQQRINLFKTLIGHDKVKISLIFISRTQPRYTTILLHKAIAYRFGIDLSYAEPA